MFVFCETKHENETTKIKTTDETARPKRNDANLESDKHENESVKMIG